MCLHGLCGFLHHVPTWLVVCLCGLLQHLPAWLCCRRIDALVRHPLVPVCLITNCIFCCMTSAYRCIDAVVTTRVSSACIDVNTMLATQNAVLGRTASLVGTTDATDSAYHWLFCLLPDVCVCGSVPGAGQVVSCLMRMHWLCSLLPDVHVCLRLRCIVLFPA